MRSGFGDWEKERWHKHQWLSEEQEIGRDRGLSWVWGKNNEECSGFGKKNNEECGKIKLIFKEIVGKLKEKIEEKNWKRKEIYV